MLPASYTAVHRYDGAMLQLGRRAETVGCPLTGRDLAIVRDVWRYRFLSTEQLRGAPFARTHAASCPPPARQALSGRPPRALPTLQPPRLLPLDLSTRPRRPPPAAGHRASRPARPLRAPRAIDYSYVLHDLQLNTWVLAYRRLLDGTLLEWHGETPIHPAPEAPPSPARPRRRLDRRRPQRPRRPARLSPTPCSRSPAPTARRRGPCSCEYDRTRRVDKNYDKFRRYDAFLTAWQQDTGFARLGDEDPPYVLFICQDPDQRDLFMAAADHELTGYRWHPATPTSTSTSAASASSSPPKSTSTPARPKRGGCLRTRRAMQSPK